MDPGGLLVPGGRAVGCCYLGECVGVRLSKAELVAHARWRW